jgi:hypothetical protein
MSKTLEDAIALTKKPIKAVYVKENESEGLPSGGINFSEISEVTGVDLGGLKEIERDVSKIAVLPYSRFDEIYLLN